MKQTILIGFLSLLPVIGVALPRQDRLQPPLHSQKQEWAWLEDPNRPKVRLHSLPPISPPAEPVLSPYDRKHIEDLITQLAEIKDPDYGLSPTMSGTQFAPIPGSEQESAGLLTAHHLNQSPAILELVQLGPAALPLLLDHLDDKTPTKLIVRHDIDIGVMSCEHEMDCNEINPVERKIKRQFGLGRDFSGPDLKTYQVKVGDVCFAIIGQIVGRRYLAVRYQPTMVIVINSPVADPRLAKAVREIWASKTPRQFLFHSLLTDYSCRGIYDGYSLAGWSQGSDRQCEAVMRLLYYYPAETAEVIATRLQQLNVGPVPAAVRAMNREKAIDWSEKREIGNGVDVYKYLQVISWCPEVRIQATLAGIVKRTDDLGVMAAVIRGIPPPLHPSLSPHIRACLLVDYGKISPMDYGASLLLAALIHYWGPDARPFFTDYMRDRDPVRLNTVCAALEDAAYVEGATDRNTNLIIPLLSDRRTIRNSLHVSDPKAHRPEILTRVCDAAAQALAVGRRDIAFDLYQSRPNLDRQIAAIKAQLAH